MKTPTGLSPKQVAFALGGRDGGWTARKVRRWIRRGRMEATWFGGRWTIAGSELERLRTLQIKEENRLARLDQIAEELKQGF